MSRRTRPPGDCYSVVQPLPTPKQKREARGLTLNLEGQMGPLYKNQIASVRFNILFGLSSHHFNSTAVIFGRLLLTALDMVTFEKYFLVLI